MDDTQMVSKMQDGISSAIRLGQDGMDESLDEAKKRARDLQKLSQNEKWQSFLKEISKDPAMQRAMGAYQKAKEEVEKEATKLGGNIGKDTIKAAADKAGKKAMTASLTKDGFLNAKGNLASSLIKTASLGKNLTPLLASPAGAAFMVAQVALGEAAALTDKAHKGVINLQKAFMKSAQDSQAKDSAPIVSEKDLAKQGKAVKDTIERLS